MKILFLDLFQTRHHDNLNKNFIKCLNEEHKVSLLCRKSLYTYDSIGYNSWKFPVILNNSRLKSLYFILRYYFNI